MYGWLWRHLPGPAVLRAILLLALATAVVLILFTVVFPWVEPRLPFGDVTVDQPRVGGSAS
jgi:hypothetical protein